MPVYNLKLKKINHSIKLRKTETPIKLKKVSSVIKLRHYGLRGTQGPIGPQGPQGIPGSASDIDFSNVDTDIEFSLSDVGLVLMAPNGGQWRLGVDNNGVLITSLLSDSAFDYLLVGTNDRLLVDVGSGLIV